MKGALRRGGGGRRNAAIHLRMPKMLRTRRVAGAGANCVVGRRRDDLMRVLGD